MGRSAAAALRTVCYVLASGVSYYAATQIAWSLTFPDSKVSLFFPPQAVLLCILLLVQIVGSAREAVSNYVGRLRWRPQRGATA